MTATARIKANGEAVLAAAGRTALAPEVAARLMGRIRNPKPALSAREVQLVELLATSMPNKEIARKLFISEATKRPIIRPA